ncbi:hypothetical protein [Crossiella sp. CA198]|uniref:hypothetical protein n=1 Tax=Crossiella sp. CA198 TaxID=3455607 RepID=UPI003F8D6329
MSTPTPAPVPCVWRRSTYDGLAHAMMLTEVTDSTKKSLSAVCTHTAPTTCWTVLTGPVSPGCGACMVEIGSLLPDPAARPRGAREQPSTLWRYG